MTRLPNFLIIGAMKAGTTTLWADLYAHPDIFMPVSKEPETLRFSDAASPRGGRRYASLFRHAQPGQLRGEASTLYTKLPHSRGISQRALELLGDNLKLIYVVRDPIDRARSHHRHLWMARKADADFDTAVRAHPEILEYGCYARQLQPWLEQFALSNLCVIRFEDFITERRNTLSRVAQFLTLKHENWQIDENARMKPGDMAAVPRLPLFDDAFYRLRMTHAYKWLAEFPLMSRIKEPIKNRLMRPVPELEPTSPSKRLIDEMVALYAPDAARLAELLGWPTPIWRTLSH